MRFILYLFGVIKNDKMPVWLTLLAAVVTALVAGYGTYYIAPIVNIELEKQKVQFSFLADNLKGWSAATERLAGDVSALSNKYVDLVEIGGRADISKLDSYRDKVRADITELGWRSNELVIVFDDAQATERIKIFRVKLDKVRLELDNLRLSKTPRPLMESVLEIEGASRDVLSLLAEKANLKAKSGNK